MPNVMNSKMKYNLKQSIDIFIDEVQTIYGAEKAIFEVSKEYENCLMLSGEIYGKETNRKINELGKIYGLTILARDLSVLYDKPIRH
jgi:hypothetical protein